MDRRTTGIVATVASVLLCGCPGLFLCLFGALSVAGLGTYELGTDVGRIESGTGAAILCLGLLLALIPLVVGFLTLRNRPTVVPAAPPPPPPPDEPLPPPS
jgi:hypothetical protein